MFKKDFPEISLLIVFIFEWIFWAISPVSRKDWLLENILVFIIVAILVLTYKKFRFSKISYLLIFIFLSIHIIGSHYTYALVPYKEWFGIENTGRNHFDRFTHFLFGLVWLYPAREFYIRKLAKYKQWSGFFAFQSIVFFSSFYELLEWGVAVIFGGELGIEYLGTQGDVWDAQKDMLLSAMGGIMALLILYIRNSKNEQ
ncbi:MAG: DUF2238 domain-containing protein [Epsilonproteobacteria bacterium]|nr:DUF2238 domain-containing protein [Campylobacterota bacterium]